MAVPRTPIELLDRAVNQVLHRPLIPFLSEPWTLDTKSRWPAILVEVFLYGIYMVLFASSSIVLWQKNRFRRMPIIFGCVLFALASTDMIVTIFFFFRFVIQNGTLVKTAPSDHPKETWNKVLEVKFAVYVIANLMNSSIMIQRCHGVWADRRIIAAPIGMVVVGTVISFASLKEAHVGDKLVAASFITSAAGNLFVTFLIATGMLWSSRKVRSIMEMDLSVVTGFIISILVESGAFYSVSIVLYLIFHSLVINASLTQIGCITTTAIMLHSSQPCEPLGVESSSFGATVTRPEMRTPEPARRHSLRQEEPSPRDVTLIRQTIDDDRSIQGINTEYK